MGRTCRHEGNARPIYRISPQTKKGEMHCWVRAEPARTKDATFARIVNRFRPVLGPWWILFGVARSSNAAGAFCIHLTNHSNATISTASEYDSLCLPRTPHLRISQEHTGKLECSVCGELFYLRPFRPDTELHQQFESHVRDNHPIVSKSTPS